MRLKSVFQVKGRQFEVKEFFLEDILRLTGFNQKDMKTYKEEMQRSMNENNKVVTNYKLYHILTWWRPCLSHSNRSRNFGEDADCFEQLCFRETKGNWVWSRPAAGQREQHLETAGKQHTHSALNAHASIGLKNSSVCVFWGSTTLHHAGSWDDHDVTDTPGLFTVLTAPTWATASWQLVIDSPPLV